MTSETQARPRDEEADVASPEPVGVLAGSSGTGSVDESGSDHVADGPRNRSRSASPWVLVLAVLLALLVAAGGYFWFTRPGESAVRTDDYAEALQAARSGVVDYTSFDYLTLDDDIEQIRRVATGDLRDAGVAKLDEGRAEIAEAEFVVNTEVVGAGVTRVDGDDATALMVIQATQESTASPQTQIVRYRIEVTLEKSGERWLLSGIKGTETAGDD